MKNINALKGKYFGKIDNVAAAKNYASQRCSVHIVSMGALQWIMVMVGLFQNLGFIA